MEEQLNFFKIALLDGQIGAMTRSSKYVVKAILRNFNNQPLSKVMEYGPGDGVVTKEILKRMPRDGKLIAVETNPKFIKVLRGINDSRLKIIEGTAQKISEKLKQDHYLNVNLVISSIPLSILSAADRERLVSNTFYMLKESGKFIVFQYSPIMLKLLSQYFGKKNIKTKLELRNVPPIFIMSAQKSTVQGDKSSGR